MEQVSDGERLRWETGDCRGMGRHNEHGHDGDEKVKYKWWRVDKKINRQIPESGRLNFSARI